MKVNKIKLYKQSLVEKDGEYEIEISDVEEAPCFITNKALQICKQLGVTKTSLAQDLMIMSSGAQQTEDGDTVITNVVEDENILKAIYVGYVGGQLMLGKSTPEYDYDEFLDRYQDDVVDRFNLYQDLLVTEENQFVQEIIRSTNKSVGKGEKK